MIGVVPTAAVGQKRVPVLRPLWDEAVDLAQSVRDAVVDHRERTAEAPVRAWADVLKGQSMQVALTVAGGAVLGALAAPFLGVHTGAAIVTGAATGILARYPKQIYGAGKQAVHSHAVQHLTGEFKKHPWKSALWIGGLGAGGYMLHHSVFDAGFGVTAGLMISNHGLKETGHWIKANPGIMAITAAGGLLGATIALAPMPPVVRAIAAGTVATTMSLIKGLWASHKYRTTVPKEQQSLGGRLAAFAAPWPLVFGGCFLYGSVDPTLYALGKAKGWALAGLCLKDLQPKPD